MASTEHFLSGLVPWGIHGAVLIRILYVVGLTIDAERFPEGMKRISCSIRYANCVHAEANLVVSQLGKYGTTHFARVLELNWEDGDFKRLRELLDLRSIWENNSIRLLRLWLCINS